MSRKFVNFMFWLGATITVLDSWLAMVAHDVPELKDEAALFLGCAAICAISTVSNYLTLRRMDAEQKPK